MPSIPEQCWPTGGAGKMFRLIHQLPDQLEASATLPGLADLARPSAPFSRVLLCGMGGSAIAGDLVQPLLGHQTMALDVWRDYRLPHWVTAETLVIVASYSGDTEESLSALVDARRRGCPLVGITSGGRLAAAAAGQGGEPFPLITLPGGLPPRAALGYGLGALVRVLAVLGLVCEADAEVAEAVRVLRVLDLSRLSPVADPEGKPVAVDPGGMPGARVLAEKLLGRVPVIYSVGDEAQGAGLRLKGQINENGKCPACLAVLPELNHNDLVGWELPPDQRGRFVLLILAGKQDNERLGARVEVTRQLLGDDFPTIHEIHAVGKRALARVLSLVQYGDYLSCHLAHAKGIDPVPVDRIDRLKDHLAKLSHET